MSDQEQTSRGEKSFDFSAFPQNTLFHERRTDSGADQSEEIEKPSPQPINADRKPRPERRKRVDPTTFEKQYSPDEMEFMSAMQRFKIQTGKPFPSHGEVLLVAHQLGYRKLVDDAVENQTADQEPAAEPKAD